MHNNLYGLRVTGSGSSVAITGSSTSPIKFDANTQYGIDVEAQGHITISGMPGVGAGEGTVTANDNGGYGLYIDQAPPRAPRLCSTT